MGLILFLLALPLAAQYKAGVARVDITPDGPIWLSGYAARTHPSDGVATKLWAKALAIEDSKRSRVVIVTTDLIGLPRAVTDTVAARLAKEHGLARASVLFNSSHTHTGPVVLPNLATMFELDAENLARAQDYHRKLTERLFWVAAAALGNLAPARVSYGSGTVGFAVNRREPTPKGMRIGVNSGGPVDHSVPVLRVERLDGRLLAVLFGYACHNTTLTGEFYQISGDYAGFAQMEFEKQHPEATAMFLMLAGADQNPNPRSSVELADKHGAALAAEVERILKETLEPLSGPIRTALEITELDFALHTRETFEAELNDRNPAKVRRARQMLQAYDERRAVRRTPYPVQAIRLGNKLAMLALGGELVVDYAVRVKKEFSGNLIVAGYSNDVMCYIPSLRVLKEGGYEAVDSMIYYGQPGPFADDVEERIFAAIHRVMKRVGVKP